ncbi:MAG: glycosyltransferase [Acidobacteriota bacterium]
MNLYRLAAIVKRRPANIIFAIKRRAFLFKERNLRSSGFSKSHSPGINLVAYIRAEMGLGQSARGMATALEAAQIPFNILNFEHSNPARHGDGSWEHKECFESKYDITVLVINPDNVFNARRRLPAQIFVNRYVIGYWVWELPTVPDEWMEAFSLVNEVWAASRFVEEAITLKSPVPVFRVPHVVRVKDGNELSRQYFNLPEKQFLFLTTCDTGSILERKNPEGTLAAFKKAFAPNDKSVGLVLKISGPHRASRLGSLVQTVGRRNRQSNLELIKEQIQGYDNIRLIDRILSPEELRSLLKVTDCYVSLHRSEGFGLVPAEAMSLGKPAIITRWSGNIDYMTDDNSVGIDYRLVKLGQDYGPYEADQHWAEPDIDQAAHWMKRLADDPALAAAIGKRGQQTILTKFSPEAVGAIIKKRLAFIRSQQPQRG